MKKYDKDPYYIATIVCLSLILLSIIIGFALKNPTIDFQKCCETMGGSMYYTSNVSCELNFIYCDTHCEINGELISFYDYYGNKPCSLLGCLKLYEKP